jgi:hypothetical protein
MKTFLALLSTIGFYGGFAMVAVYFAAFLFVMRNLQFQEFILQYGPEMIYGPMIVSLAAEECKDRLEKTLVPGRDSIVAGILGTICFLATIWAYVLPSAPILSGIKFTLLIIMALFAWAMSLAFYLKEEASWKQRSYKP